jgi:hypothetical protein
VAGLIIRMAKNSSTHLINASVELEARQVQHPEKVFGVTFISNDQTPEVLQLGKQPLDFLPSSVSISRRPS